MKTIEPVSIWDNGQVMEAVILDAYASLVSLGISATFYYAMYSENEEGYIGYQLSTGSLTMSGEAYQQWAQDSYAWDWIAEQLNLTITGDYIPPVPPEPTPEPTPIVEEEVASEEPIA
jgi:hypothetical protein